MQRAWQVQDLLDWTKTYFERLGISEPRLEAEVLLSHALNTSRINLYVEFDRPVNHEERRVFREMIKRRAAGEPAAYLIGRREFMSLPFMVDSRVLIPRPDSEILVEESIRLISSMKGEAKVVDVGTGSGALAISIAKYVPTALVYATDIDQRALEVAPSNSLLNEVESRVIFLQGHLLEPVYDLHFDLILANLPYIPSEKMNCLPRGVREFEPSTALDGGPQGISFYKELINSAYPLLNEYGYLLMEVSDREQIDLLLKDAVSGWIRHYTLQDLGRRDRVLVLQKGR
ncbi:MAG: peptide chain release factor N(5)-glutamine methyltransferase [Syntrophomonadaceae bacterium]|nr:peptide chain release factor N(5)-glutamine methyltransferase [Syntrophomonadaceae bacterium]